MTVPSPVQPQGQRAHPSSLPSPNCSLGTLMCLCSWTLDFLGTRTVPSGSMLSWHAMRSSINLAIKVMDFEVSQTQVQVLAVPPSDYAASATLPR